VRAYVTLREGAERPSSAGLKRRVHGKVRCLKVKRKHRPRR
jgi:hypothetical protein